MMAERPETRAAPRAIMGHSWTDTDRPRDGATFARLPEKLRAHRSIQDSPQRNHHMAPGKPAEWDLARSSGIGWPAGYDPAATIR